MAILPLIWFLVWTLGNWRARWRLTAGFLAGLVFLVGLGEVVLPGWISYFVDGLKAYQKYAPTTTPLLQLIIGDIPGRVLSGVLILALLALAWHHRGCSPDSHHFTFTLAVFLLSETIILPLFTPFNQVLLLLPVLMILQEWRQLPAIFRVLFALCLGWPSVASVILLALPPDVRSLNQLPLLPSVSAIFVPVLLLPLIASIRREHS